jgi:peptide deformylase
VINPKIANRTKVPVDSREACMSFPDRKSIIVPRSHKIIVTCVLTDQAAIGDHLVAQSFTRMELSGRDAMVFQHEIDHMDGKYIFDEGGVDNGGE